LVGTIVLRTMRWRIEGSFPDRSRFVIIVAPHTSNWDFVIGFAAYLALQIEANWLGKHTLFRGPFGPILRYFGGIPVVRSASTNVVEQYITEFRNRERLIVAIAPEGTRRRVDEWKSGFYRIAVGAGVAIVPVALDFSTRVIRILPPHEPSGDYDADLPRLKSYFTPAMARYPALY
jgi:1-acyl-sn-glycerol-3-phosphate acyltransferase